MIIINLNYLYFGIGPSMVLCQETDKLKGTSSDF